MRKIFLLLCVVLCGCPIPARNFHTVARSKEKLTYNLVIKNDSSVSLDYKYAPVPQRTDFDELVFVQKYMKSKESLDAKGLSTSINRPNTINIYGTVKKSCESKKLYTGIDCGAYLDYDPFIEGYPNVNVDGLPARFVIMIEGDSRCYSLVYNCKKGSENSTVVITDETIKRLQTFKEDELKFGYNGRRDYYGKSVKIQENLYCFERLDLKGNSLIDYAKISGIDHNITLYGRIYLTKDESVGFTHKGDLILYSDNEDKLFYIKDDASVNSID